MWRSLLLPLWQPQASHAAGQLEGATMALVGDWATMVQVSNSCAPTNAENDPEMLPGKLAVEGESLPQLALHGFVERRPSAQLLNM
jgi:hypothetical protein